MQKVNQGSVMILFATLGFGLIPMFAQVMMASGFSADAITLYRFLVPILIFSVGFQRNDLDALETLRTVLLGFFAGCGMVLFMRAIEQTSAISVILLYYSYPFFSILIGNLFFGQGLTRNSLSSAFLILIAVSLTLDPETINPDHLPMILGSLLAPISFALLIQYFSHPVKSMQTNQRMVVSFIGTLVAIIPLTLSGSGYDGLLPDEPKDYYWILIIGLFSAALPQYLFVKGAPLAGSLRTTSLSSLEVIVAMMTGAWFLGTPLSRMHITAAALIVIAQMIRQDEGLPKTGKYAAI